jgi:two-component system chemotaxis response regulator CheB
MRSASSSPGNGDDGAEGLLEMRNAGAHTIAQDQETCIVHGMPRAAEALGAVVESAPLARIPFLILGRLAAESGPGARDRRLGIP